MNYLNTGNAITLSGKAVRSEIYVDKSIWMDRDSFSSMGIPPVNAVYASVPSYRAD